MKYYFCFLKGCLCALVFLGLLPSASAELSDSRKEQLVKLVEEPLYDCKYLNAEEKEFLKRHFYEVNKRTNNPEACDYQLLQVGDEATIKRYVKKFETMGWKYRGAPEHSGQALFIEVYAPTMFREEPFVSTPGDTPSPPPSYFITYAIVRLLRESPQLRPEVRHWALSLSDDEQDLPKNRTILRQWWRANERHFRARNYQAVQPPADPANPSSPAGAPMPPDGMPPAPSPPSTAPATSETAAKSSPLIPGLITALCAILLALAYWIMARREKPRP